MSHRYAAPALVAIAIAIALHCWNLGGGTLDAWDEALSAERAREMMQAGSWITPLLDGEPDWNKPPLYYWLVIGGYRTLGVGELAVRLPAALFGLACAALVYAIGCRLTASRAGGLVAATLLVVNPHWLETVRQGLLDSGLTAAMLAGACVLSAPAPSVRRSLLGGALIGLGAAIKNPLAVLAFAMPLAAWRLAGTRMPWRALAIAAAAFLLVGGAWYAIETLRHGRAFLDFHFGYNIWQRVTSGHEGHRTELLLYARKWPEETPATLLAFVVPLVWAIRRRDAIVLRRVAPLLALIAVWLVAIHVSVSKRPVYLVPLHAFVAAASAPLVLAMSAGLRSARVRHAIAGAFGVAALVVLGTRYDAALDFSPDFAAAARDVAARANPADAIIAVETPRHVLSFYAQREVHRMHDWAWVPGSRESWVIAPRQIAEALRQGARAREPDRPIAIECVSERACVVAVGRRAERE